MEILMALFDFVPVILCFIAMLKLQICLYDKMNKYSFALLASGSIMILSAGSSKAIWKILYYGFNIDLYRLNFVFFPIQSLGFILAFLGILFMIINKLKIKKGLSTYGLLLVTISPDNGKTIINDLMIYVSLQILGCAGIYGCLIYFAKKLNKKIVILFTVLSFVCILMMGFLSSKINNSTGSDYIMYNWMAEIVNSIGQLMFLLGIIKLEKAGLKEMNLIE